MMYALYFVYIRVCNVYKFIHLMVVKLLPLRVRSHVQSKIILSKAHEAKTNIMVLIKDKR